MKAADATKAITREEAFQACGRYLRSRSRLFHLLRLQRAPRRDHLTAVFAWDALVREVAASPEPLVRRRRLDELQHELDRVLGFDDPSGAKSPHTFAGVALATAVRLEDLPAPLFRGPLAEHRGLEGRTSFETEKALRNHAGRIANPLGRAVLRCLGASNERNELLSDALCTGLQRARWLATLVDAWRRGRLYLPADEVMRRGIELRALDGNETPDALRALVADQVRDVRRLLEKGWALCASLGPGRGRQLAFVLRWHAATLSSLEARRLDVGKGVPPAGLLRLLACLCASLASTQPPRLR